MVIVCILSISAISATENTANKEVTNTEINQETNIQYDDVSTSNMNDELILEENNGRDEESRFRTDKTTTTNDNSLTFTELNKTINDNTKSTIYLSNNYKYDNNSDVHFENGISISRDLTIYGNGVTLDGNHYARIFDVSSTNLNVNFYNINFINGQTSSNGGAISGGNAYNCIFTGNKAQLGGAIFNGVATKCTFEYNSAGKSGGAINQGNAYNCTFNSNSANIICGAIAGNAYNCKFNSNSANNGGAIAGNAYNCTFTINNAKENGGAIYFGNATNCTFNGNTASYGGAIWHSNAYNCTFYNNTAKFGGASYYGDSTNCIFIENKAEYKDVECTFGGAIYYGNAYNCTFNQNNAENGGAIYFGNATNCTFNQNNAENGGAIYFGNATNCTFNGNTASYGGAINQGNATNSTFNQNKAYNGGAMYKGNATLCRFNNDTTYETNIIRASINVLHYMSPYQSGEKLQFNLTANGILYDGFNTTIRIYKNEGLVKIVYGLTGEGWVVDLIPGRYTAKLSIPSYSGVTPSYAQITVLNLASEIITSPESTTYNVGKNLVITLKDENGNPISDALLTVTLDSTKKYTTDTNGQVKINVATLTPKTYTAKITYAGSNLYNGTTGTTKVTVKKATPKITAKSASFKLKVKTKQYTATFKDNKNQALKNTKVTLKVNGKTYSVKTNNKGQGVFKITNLKKIGSYSAVITVPANTYYNKVTKNVKITVKQ